MLIKACGIRKIEDIDIAAEFKYTAIGIVLHPKSSRYCDRSTTNELLSYSRSKYPEMIIFAVAKYDCELFDRENFDYIQSHENRNSRDLIKVNPVNKENKKYFLYDVSEGKGIFRDIPGWLSDHSNVIIAGGLTPENVNEVIRRIDPVGVDVSSGIETNGLKDKKKMKDFVEEVMNANKI